MTHDDVRDAAATIIGALTVSGTTLRVSDAESVADMYATDSRIGVVVAVDEAPGDEWDTTRAFVLRVQAMAAIGASVQGATSWCATAGRAIRTALLTSGALGGAQVVDASRDDITRAGGAVVLTQSYTIQAPR